MPKANKNLPIDHKWTPDLGVMGKSHKFVDGEYVDSTYEHQEYPKMKYHADYVHQQKPGIEYGFTQNAQTVNSIEDEADLGSDWKDSPSAAGVITAPDAEMLRAKQRKQSAQGANWRAALPNSNPDLTEVHLRFLQSQGVEAKNLSDVFTFLAGLTSQQMNSFMQEAKSFEQPLVTPKRGRPAAAVSA